MRRTRPLGAWLPSWWYSLEAGRRLAVACTNRTEGLRSLHAWELLWCAIPSCTLCIMDQTGRVGHAEVVGLCHSMEESWERMWA